MRRYLLPLVMVLNACVPVTQTETATRAISNAVTLPPFKSFGAPRPVAPQKSNNDLALDFIELSFLLESGRELPILTRFETPVTVRVTGNPPPSLRSDLDRLLHRLRTEAGIDISQTDAPQANITINAVTRADIRAVLPRAACFVAPNVTSLDEYRAARRSSRTNWSKLKERRQLAIFLPNDSSPQETRDCLHEELAQALGPLNDLYRLPDSVFNDDNVHTVLTGFDMLILKAYYAPELHSGMTRSDVARKLPAVLARINPAGERRHGNFASRTPLAWKVAVQRALGQGATTSQRKAAAANALRIAERMGWQDNRRAFAHYANGRLLQASEPGKAYEQYKLADKYYARTSGTTLHRAFVATQLAAFSIIQGDGAKALAILSPHLDVAARNENAALLSTLLLMRAEALDLENRATEARAVRLDSLGWARYGFGSDWAVRAKLREIAALSPLKG